MQSFLLYHLHNVIIAHMHYITAVCGCPLQVVQYADDDDIGGLGEMYDDDASDDFKAPGTSAAARKRLEPML